jgi:MtN3 and saliva related transmembrane protein
MDKIFLLGLMAGTLTSISFIPQAVRIYRTRSARDLSMPMFFIFSSGVILWLSYGILIQDLPIILTNTITLLLCLSIIAMKFWFR